MVPKEQYGRANGMMSLIEAGPGVVAPLLAGMLLPIMGLTGLREQAGRGRGVACRGAVVV